jgi:5-methyltetrahydrofolate--homocysteine methyltransferase
VEPETFVKAVEEHGAQIVCLSALLTTTMPMIEATIGALEQAEIRQQVKIMVGGAPVTQAYASQVGADGYAPEAATAVDEAKALLGVAS